MTQNVLQVGTEVVGMVVSIVVLFLFALTVALPHRPKVLPGSMGHRDAEDQTEHEVIRADGFIDSFAGVIEEAGGSLPWIVRLAIPGVLLSWLFILILNWAPR